MNRNPWSRRNQWSIVDARSASQASLDFDIVVIGSGAGGATASAALSQHGFRVAIIEDGDLVTAKNFAKSEQEAYGLYQDRGSRFTQDKTIGILQGRSVGGSTTVNWTSSFRTPVDTLQFWQDQYAVEWSKDELIPHFQKHEADLNIHRWEGLPNPNNSVLERGLKNLGLDAQRIPRNVSGCHNLGYCGQGCPVNAKLSMVITRIPEALDHGATLIHNCFVHRLQWYKNRVTELHCQASEGPGKRSGQVLKIKAKHFILAAGSIGSPGILLRSHVPDPYDQLGRRTTLHPVLISGALFKESITGWHGAPQSVYSDQFLRPKNPKKLGYKLEVSPMFPMLMAGILPSLGYEHRAIMTRFERAGNIIALLRDGYHDEAPGGRVVLDDNGRAVLSYPWTDALADGARRALLTMAEIQLAAGADEIIPFHCDGSRTKSFSKATAMIAQLTMKPPFLKVMSAHVMGGCSMGKPEQGVVDSWGRHHHLHNLNVLDGSIFPSSLGVNPQLSIYGITSLLTEHLVQELDRESKQKVH
ncbi:FAD-dependent oxidoreductase [Pseudobacteriovorax antillogorgiicola]|uniref:Choline dehydrogenase n=1 Tax=Pseudobacteriovorax antillogorgiicola TaxID=1513793 RepID=A0A1Y6CFH4_9BACT|nr:FAD-dependent oxidoreductase [Pseudobacteriovorax antillogorgiicola]TCS49064.1 choline dehydrogenase-like flavoprotein [Pseudobacteriovorax antillogorgiicola]SMF52308.1 Choline dehydrogenase [Pseudobacteriovorax antillogorgiicola]